ncbi:MAG: hypothetical protein R3240_12155, partial [Gammaproteobacteria bacterium]|nr:hypothetical protein [Gammaproteobacteria bacterium]
GDSGVNVTSSVNCLETGSATLTIENCHFIASTAGIFNIGAELLNPQTNEPTVDPVNINVQAVVVTQLSLDAGSIDVESDKDSQQTVSLTREFNNGSTESESLSIDWNATNAAFTVNGYVSSYDAGSGKLQINDAQSNLSVILCINLIQPPPQLTGFSLDIDSIVVESGVDSSKTMLISREFDNGSSDTIDVTLNWNGADESFSAEGFDASFNTDASVLTLTEAISASSATISVAVLAAGTLIDKLYFSETNMTLVSGNVTPLVVKARYTDGTIAELTTGVSCTSDSLDLIGVEYDCSQLSGWFPGAYVITPQLDNAALAASNLEVLPLQVDVTPIYLDSLANTSSFDLAQNIATSVVSFEIDGAAINQAYKFQLQSAGPRSLINMHALSSPVWGEGCNNETVIGESKLACGVEATSNSLYLVLETLDYQDFGNLDFQLNVTEDNNILQFDGNHFAGTYADLFVGTNYTGGHVAANTYTYNNISVYHAVNSSTAPLNLDPAKSDYKVQIMFANSSYQADTVKVSYNAIGVSQTIFSANCSNDIPTKTITCTVPNAETPSEIVVKVFGNGANYSVTQNSVTATEGEIDYDILI